MTSCRWWMSLFLMVASGPAVADWPLSVIPSEQQPPTQEDWLRLYVRRSSRAYCPDCEPPVLTFGEVRYLPEAACCVNPESGVAAGYGLRHPQPYYIPAQPKYLQSPDGRVYEAASLRKEAFRSRVTPPYMGAPAAEPAITSAAADSTITPTSATVRPAFSPLATLGRDVLLASAPPESLRLPYDRLADSGFFQD